MQSLISIYYLIFVQVTLTCERQDLELYIKDVTFDETKEEEYRT